MVDGEVYICRHDEISSKHLEAFPEDPIVKNFNLDWWDWSTPRNIDLAFVQIFRYPRIEQKSKKWIWVSGSGIEQIEPQAWSDWSIWSILGLVYMPCKFSLKPGRRLETEPKSLKKLCIFMLAVAEEEAVLRDGSIKKLPCCSECLECPACMQGVQPEDTSLADTAYELVHGTQFGGWQPVPEVDIIWLNRALSLKRQHQAFGKIFFSFWAISWVGEACAASTTGLVQNHRLLKDLVNISGGEIWMGSWFRPWAAMKIWMTPFTRLSCGQVVWLPRCEPCCLVLWALGG